ncbi:MAG: AAA family ATPase [Candidatus Thiodiazotropha sp. (ex Myrtea sp. 'scaly one' KF741663)]|nr:AAA family ATPase [Candidatus Thiodiazotropha sp. (ex Myrtea sp. 'scaly one' KF741663)]
MITKIKIQGYRIYKDFELKPNQKLNLIVGANESGKSTLIEAISLALTGRINGKKAAEELNPYWFNTALVNQFVASRQSGGKQSFPKIKIELFFEGNDQLQELCGAHNSDVPTNACPGIKLEVTPNPEYSDDMEIWAKSPSLVLPTDYYQVDWRPFTDIPITRQPKKLATAIIDSRTVRSTSGVDYHLREILNDYLDPNERVAISQEFRQVKASMSDESLKGVNDRIGKLHASLHDKPISLAMDQSARTTWEGAITPHVDQVPFSMSGQGQQAAIKISLAMNKHSDKASFVMVEEPENHLSHTSLATLLSRMEELSGEQQQIFISTHSSFVLNRLGLDSILLMGADKAEKIANLQPETVSYFKKLPGYDTLRMALANKIVLVEGPSDEIVFERFFKDKYKKMPMECGIDVLSMRGLSLKKCLEFCSALDKTVAALRDNDGNDPKDLESELSSWLKKGEREVFIGDNNHGNTLEPQLLSFNSEESLRSILGIANTADINKWMTREKTESAIRISESSSNITPPDYIKSAVEFIND